MRIVYAEIQERLKNLLQIRRLMSKQHDRHTVQLFPLDVEYLTERFEDLYPELLFRLQTLSVDEFQGEMQLARTWLSRILLLQARHFPKENLIRILRFGIEKDSSKWTDMERLYMMLTNGDEDEAEYRLDDAFATVIHFQYASRHETVLIKLKELDEHNKRSLSKRQMVAIDEDLDIVVARIGRKAKEANVAHFTCAVPVDATVSASSSENPLECPICRNDALDLDSFPVDEIINDYPVKIKHCGHIIGKECLEQWMRTPLINEAINPYHTCPACRVRLEFGDDEEDPVDVPEWIQEHTYYHRNPHHLQHKLRLDEEECHKAILDLLSDEIATEEMLGEINRRVQAGIGDKSRLTKAKVSMERRMAMLQIEKKIWGFEREPEMWKKTRAEWMNTMF